MERFVKGDVVVVSFPFTDFSSSKTRPALVIATPEGDDAIICQITSSRNDKYCVPVNVSDFKSGELQIPSNIRTNKLLTINKTLIKYKIGALKEDKTQEMIRKIEEILNA